MTRALRMTSKRQVTFPAQVCEELGIEAGKEVLLERREVDGRPAWFLRPRTFNKEKWFGSLHKYASGKPHDMPTIQQSIGKALGARKR